MTGRRTDGTATRTLNEEAAVEILLSAFPPTGDVPPAEWSSIETQLGVALPLSFKRLCDIYGDERLKTTKSNVRLWCPQSQKARSRFPSGALKEVKRLTRDLSEERVSPKKLKGLFFPDEGGLLPWVSCEGVAYFAVARKVDPDYWPVAFPSGVLPVPPIELGAPGPAAFLVERLGLPEATPSPQGRKGRPAAEPRPKSAPAQPPAPGVTWRRVEVELRARGASLSPAASEQQVSVLARSLKQTLPDDLRSSLAVHDGLSREAGMLIREGELCSTKTMAREHASMIAMQRDGSFDGFELDADPDPEIKGDVWWREGWLPLVSSDGDYLVVDLDPAPGGVVGQVFAFGRLHGPGYVVAPSLAAWLVIWADGLEKLPAEYGMGPVPEEGIGQDAASPVWPEKPFL